MNRLKSLFIALTVVFSVQLSAQSSLQPAGVDLDYVTWVDGDVLVRFEDHITINFDKYNKTGIGPIDAILQDLEIKEVEQLFPYTINIPDKADGFYTYNGLYVEYPTLHNIYRINFKDSMGENLFDVIDDLAALTEYVRYAEPNYYSGIMGVSPANEPNDTLYSQQWANEAIQADTVQARMAADSTVSDTNQVIAIIDTGVDKDHEDLENKMWVNTAELNGSPNVDDDQNGFVDDIYGWDFINNDGNPMDDNSHGTHCAGSAAAEVNNQKGIAGVSPGAKIMGVKVMQSSGYGAAADIAQGILYAANNGASVISMSIGGAGRSQVTENALAVAYAYSFLVAAAGNNNICIGRPSPIYKCPDGKTPQPFFPAAYSYVLGVESSSPNGNKSGFSNYDEDGRLVSYYSDLLNYEVRAPGSQIISCKPAGNTGNNGRYNFSQGTSMACPAVAGAVSLLKSFKPTFTHEKVFLHLIKTQTNNINLNTAIDYVLPSEITYVTTTVVDTLGGDEDSRADAGELVELVMKLKNIGGYNDSIWASIELDPLEDPNLVEFIDSVRFFGSVSEYATIENNLPDSAIYPFKIKLDSNIANAREIKFKIKLWTGDSTFVDSNQFTLLIQNGIEFNSGYYSGTTVMKPNAYYLIAGTALFDTLIIKPGTTVYVEQNSTINAGAIYAIGKPDSLISMEGVRGNYWSGLAIIKKWVISSSQPSNYSNASQSPHGSTLKYCHIKNLGGGGFGQYYIQNFFRVEDNIFQYCDIGYDVWSYSGGSNYNRITNTDSTSSYWSAGNDTLYYDEWQVDTSFYITSNYSSRPLFSKRNVFLDNQMAYVRTQFSNSNQEAPQYQNNSDYFIRRKRIYSTSYGYRVEKEHLRASQEVRDNLDLVSQRNSSTIYANNTHWEATNNPSFSTAPRIFNGDNGGAVYLNSTVRVGSNYYKRFMDATTQYGQTILNTVYPKNLYLGGNSQQYYSNLVKDYFNDNRWSLFATDSMPNTISNSDAHGYVVDIRIDNKSAHWIDNPYNTSTGTGIIGNGTYKFTVQFNRAMDVEVTPLLTFGIREPWTQNIVADSSYWSADSSEFNAYVTIDPLTQSDGINRISVRLAKDEEGFLCPTENVRFECRISSTGSLSAGFAAVGDTGKIHLDWGIPDEEIDDYLGTNMYRIDSTNLTNPTYVYGQMQVDSMMTDTTVQAGQWYGYYYKIVRTSLTELNESDTVWARPWQGKPSVETRGVTNKTHNSVTINGKVNPNYLATQVRFNYGTSSNYTTNTSWQNIGNGDDFLNRSVSLSGLTPGTAYHYRIEAKNVEGTSYGEDSTFTTKDFPNLAYSYDSTLCVGDDAAFTNQSTISNGTLSYSWEIRNSNGSLVHSSTATSPTFTMSAAGTYTVKLTASSSDAVTTTKITGLVVEAIPTPSISTSGATSFCQGGTVTLSGNTGYQNYVWSNGASTSSITVSDSNTYTLTVTSANGCQGSTSVNVDVNPLPTATVSSATSSFDFCDGGSLDLSAPSGAAGYQWYKDGSAITGGTSTTYSATASGSYAVEVTSADGCISLSTAQTVTKNTNPTATISSTSALSFCDGDSVTLSAPAGMTYAWTTGATTQSITQSTSGQVGLTITDANGCSATATPVMVNVHNVPSMTVSTPSGTSFCQGQSVTLQASGGFASYAWSNGSTNQNIIATTAGSYTVTGTTSDGCSTTSSTTSVTVNANPVATITNVGSSVLCAGDSTTLSAPSGMSAYLWSSGETTASITTSTAANYSVTVTNADGCSATSAATAITTSSITTPTITASGATTLCSGSAVTLSVPTGYASYSWSDGSTTNSITTGTAGNYSVTVTNADGCSVTTSATAVTVNTPPTAAITSTGTGAICAGASETLSGPSGMSAYQWYKDGTAIVGATSSSYTANTAANYSVSVIDANGCSALSTNYTITNAAAPVATITNAGSSVLCAGDSTTLSAPSGMSAYLWSSGETTASITTSTAANYSVTVTNADGCSATSAATAITASAIATPMITSNGPLEFCDGGSVSLAVPMGYSSFMWNNGSGFSQITVNASGDYYAQVMNADGCSATSDTVTVEVFPTPPTPSISYTANDTVMTSSEATGNQWYFNGNMMPGETGQTLRPMNLGNYSVRIIDTNGCEGDMSAMQFYNSIGMEENLADQIALYPNPTQGRVTLELNQLEVASLRVVDATGRTVVDRKGCTGMCELDLSDTGSGMYQIVMITTDGKQVIKPVVVSK